MMSESEDEEPDPATRWLVIGSAAMLVAGAFLPWASMSAAFVGTMSQPGIAGDGMFTAGLGVVALIVAGPLMGNRPLSRNRAVGLVLVGLAAGFIAGATAFSVAEMAREIEVGVGQVGIGLWVTIAAAVVLVIGAGRQVPESSQ